ncbi:DUF3718 domain-containing protein [Thalassotalea fusca]
MIEKFTIGLIFAFTLLFPIESKAFNLSQTICEYIAADDKKRLRKLQKTNKFKLRNVFKDIRCNDDNILIFAAKQNANDVGELLIKKLPKSILIENMGELESHSAILAEIAKKRSG